MKKSIWAICIICSLVFSSCKNDAKTNEEKEEQKTEKTIKLSNYSDTNWKSGVGIEYNMFIVDNTKKNMEIVKAAKKFVFADGTFATVTGVKEADTFIQINLTEVGSTFQNEAEYPNEIKIE